MRNVISTKLIVVMGILMTMSFGVAQADRIIGDYLEIRSDGIHMEPCFYSDITGGKEATLIWHVRNGVYNGIPLAGLTTVAVITAENNLATDTSTRRSALYVDAAATFAQRQALEILIKKERRDLLGEVVIVKALPIKFKKKGSIYSLKVENALRLETSSLVPLNSHPSLYSDLWYAPFEPIKSVQVGEAEGYIYNDNVLSVRWVQPTQSAFIGEFTISFDSEKYVRVP